VLNHFSTFILIHWFILSLQNNPSALVYCNGQVQAKHIFSKRCLFIGAFGTAI